MVKLPDDGSASGVERRWLLHLAAGLLSLVALLVYPLVIDPPCNPPPPCGEEDEKAGRCTPQPYPCSGG